MTMSGFKEEATADIMDTFFNVEEFGERHRVNGKEMTVVIDGIEVVERSKKQVEQGRIDGVYKSQIILYVPRSTYGALPAKGKVVQLDKSSYRVTDAIDEGGVYSITLEAVRS